MEHWVDATDAPTWGIRELAISNAISIPIPLTLLLRHWMLSYRIFEAGWVFCGSDVRRLRRPQSSGGIQFDSIIILPSIYILRFPRPYRLWIYPNPTYPSYRILTSAIWRGIQRITLILPALCILPCPRSYRIGVYRNPTYSIYHILSSTIWRKVCLGWIVWQVCVGGIDLL